MNLIFSWNAWAHTAGTETYGYLVLSVVFYRVPWLPIYRWLLFMMSLMSSDVPDDAPVVLTASLSSCGMLVFMSIFWYSWMSIGALSKCFCLWESLVYLDSKCMAWGFPGKPEKHPKGWTSSHDYDSTLVFLVTAWISWVIRGPWRRTVGFLSNHSFILIIPGVLYSDLDAFSALFLFAKCPHVFLWRFSFPWYCSACAQYFKVAHSCLW